MLSQFVPLDECCSLLVDGYVAGDTAVAVAREGFPKRACTAFVHTGLSRVICASGNHADPLRRYIDLSLQEEDLIRIGQH
eukprot:10714977-Alexandrium_andersonii.AAC.1